MLKIFGNAGELLYLPINYWNMSECNQLLRVGDKYTLLVQCLLMGLKEIAIQSTNRIFRTSKPISEFINTQSTIPKNPITINCNPCQNQIQFNIETFIINPLNITIYDLYGQQVISKKINPNENIVNIEFLENGIYFWKTSTNYNQNRSAKVIVLK